MSNSKENNVQINQKNMGKDHNINYNDDKDIIKRIEEFKCLKKRNNETFEQFLFRGKLFLRVYDDLTDENTALKYSNIWVNILSLDCSYQNDVMELVEKYRPSEEENVYKNPIQDR